MATPTYADKISKAQVMLAGLKNNAELIARRGLDADFLAKMDATRTAAVSLNDEQEKLEADLKTKTQQLDASLAELEKMVSEAQKIVKMDFEQSRWTEFGIAAKH